jgi:hypothetical protein
MPAHRRRSHNRLLLRAGGSAGACARTPSIPLHHRPRQQWLLPGRRSRIFSHVRSSDQSPARELEDAEITVDLAAAARADQIRRDFTADASKITETQQSATVAACPQSMLAACRSTAGMPSSAK